jgi:hypothetical protein
MSVATDVSVSKWLLILWNHCARCSVHFDFPCCWSHFFAIGAVFPTFG